MKPNRIYMALLMLLVDRNYSKVFTRIYFLVLHYQMNINRFSYYIQSDRAFRCQGINIFFLEDGSTCVEPNTVKHQNIHIETHLEFHTIPELKGF